MAQKKIPKVQKHAADTKADAETKKDSMCAACKTDGENRPAVKYCVDCSQPICQYCVDSHRRIRLLRDHKLVDHSSEEAVKGAKSLSSCLSCPNHPEKSIEFICKSHNIMCCITCATASHRNCRQVVEVSSQSKTASIHSETTGLIKHLDAAKTQMEQILKKHTKHNQNVQSHTEVAIPQQIQDMKKMVMETLDVLEERAKAESRALGQQEISRGKAEINKWESMIKTVTEATALLMAAQQNASDVQLYVAMHNVQKSLKEIDRAILKQGGQLARCSVLFEQGKALQDRSILVNNVLMTLMGVDGKSDNVTKENKAKPEPGVSAFATSSSSGDSFYQGREDEGPYIEPVLITARDFEIALREYKGDARINRTDSVDLHEGIEDFLGQPNQEMGLGTVTTTGASSGSGAAPGQQSKGSNQATITTASIRAPVTMSTSGFGLFPYRKKPGFHNPVMPKSPHTDPRALASVSVQSKVYSLPRYPFSSPMRQHHK